MSMEFQPIENVEAARAIASKTAVGREVFDKLLPELRARAFVVSGLEDLRMVRAVRDAIEELPKGGDWDETVDKVRGILEKGGFGEETAAARAEMLVKHHAYAAYAQADWEAKQRMKQDFPYWKYVTQGDGRVRDSHAALDGLVLPADDPFWKDHFPPWEWGCRCRVEMLDEEEYKEIVDAGRVAGNRKFDGSSEDQRVAGWTLGKAGMKQLHDAGTLDDGTGRPVLLNKPREETYHWHPGESSMRASDLHARYAKGEGAAAEQDWDGFYEQMQGVRIPDEQGRERPAWDWVIKGDVREAAREVRKITADKGVEAVIALDYKTGERYGETVTGTENRVNNGLTLGRANQDGRELVVVHTHTRESIPSPSDIIMALDARKVLKLCVMTTPGGKMHVFRRPAEAEGGYFEFMVEMAKVWGENFDEDGWMDALGELKESGVLDYEA